MAGYHIHLVTTVAFVFETTEEDKADVWMMGDFNFEDGEEDRGLPPQVRDTHTTYDTLPVLLRIAIVRVAVDHSMCSTQWSQFVDVWPSLYPTQAGYTFDPQRNAMAAETTSSGRSR